MNYGADPSRRNSLDQEGGVRERSVVLVRERKLVPVDLVRTGMMRFSFLLETCHPGSIPDPQLIAAVLDLVSLSAYSSLLVLLTVYLCIRITDIETIFPDLLVFTFYF